MKTNRILCLMLCITMIFGCFGSLTSSAVSISNITSKLPQDNYDKIEQDLNQLRLDTSVIYTITERHELSSMTDDYAYFFYELSPYGYAIYDSKNFILQEANLLTDVLPYNFNQQRVNIYLGPSNYFYIDKNTLTIKDYSNQVLNDSQVEVLHDTALSISNFVLPKQLQEKAEKTKTSANTRVAANLPIFVSNPMFFVNILGDNYHNNLEDVCTMTAIEMLLCYYRYYLYPNIIPSQYVSGGGVNSAFFSYLTSFKNSNDPKNYSNTSAGVAEASVVLTNYLIQSANMSAYATYHTGSSITVYNDVYSVVSSGRPLVAAMFAQSGMPSLDPYAGHSVVVYGVAVNDDVTQYLTHYGWHSQYGSYSATWANASWFMDSLYINSN